jgi:transcriptional/translational regulatory protein YebC/TACO1
MVSSVAVDVSDPGEARKILRIVDALEDNDDVQDVFANFDIPDSVMETLDA